MRDGALLDVVAADLLVAVRYRGTGTRQGAFLDIPATGNTVEQEAAAFARFDGEGTIVEYRGFVDNHALLQQLGVLPDDVGG
jgi:predicted ester cyclase